MPSKKYYNKEKQSIYNRRYREKTPRHITNARYTLCLSVPANKLKKLARAAVWRARQVGREYDKDYLFELAATQPDLCACCSKTFNYASGRGKNVRDSPSLDRIDSSKGYVRNNVIIICHKCNATKSDATIEYLMTIVNYMGRNKKLASYVDL